MSILLRVAVSGKPVPIVLLFVAACASSVACPCDTVPDEGRYRRISADPIRNRLVDLFPCDSLSDDARRAAAMLLLTGDSAQPFEVHDCQKLVLAAGQRDNSGEPGENDRFGPLIGIFPLDSAVASPAAAFSNPKVVATIYNWSDEPYRPIGLLPGWSCLWLTNATGGWRAFLTPPPDTMGCAQPITEAPEEGTFQYLQVTRLTDSTVTNYPSTARWGWDGLHREHLMGIRCANGWCLIGLPGFVPGSTLTSGNPLTRVPGMYDEQHLAVLAADSSLVPGPFGRIYPATDSDSLSAESYESGPQAVAYVVLYGSATELAHYERTLGFSAHSGQITTLKLARDKAAPNASMDFNEGWFMEVSPAPGTSHRLEVIRKPMSHGSGGAVRWRWNASDETTWTPCRDGCCSPTPM